ncbi:ABC transporter ATP-binding protein [Celeribacter sp. ULVN23_4]
MSRVVLKDLRKSFGAVEVIKGVDLEIESGEFCVFVGPSGCGKSTLLRMISGLEDASSGLIEIDGEDVTHVEPSKRGIAMVFQSYALYPHLTVRENIGFGLSLARTPKDEIKRRVDEVAKVLQLEALLDRKPKALSGGQRQRVAIGRSIVRNPKVFLFDEPLSNLDAALRSQMRIELTELHQRLGTTMIYVTHDQVEAMTMADKIVVLNGGNIEQVGSPMDLYERPATPFVAGFIGSPKMNLYNGNVAEAMGCRTYGIRPEHVTVSETDGQWPCDIRHVERLGADTILHLDCAVLGELTVRVDGSRNFALEQRVYATPQEGREFRYGAESETERAFQIA